LQKIVNEIVIEIVIEIGIGSTMFHYVENRD